MLYGLQALLLTIRKLDAACRRGRRSRGDLFSYNRRSIWLEIEIQTLRNDAGELTGCKGLQLDVTEWHEAELKCKCGEALYRFILNPLPMGVGLGLSRFGPKRNLDQPMLYQF